MRRSLLTISALLLPLLAYGQVVSVKHKPGFVELVADSVPDGASVTWEPRKPFDLPFLDRQNLDGQRVCIMHLQAGEYAVLLDVIDWDNRKRIKRVFAIEVDGALPGPDNPPSPPTPDPDDGGFTGILRDIHIEARQGPWTPSQVQGLADNYDTVAAAINAGGIPSIRLASVKLRELNAKLKVSDPWHKLKGMITDYLVKEAGDDGTMAIKEYASHLVKIAEALR